MSLNDPIANVLSKMNTYDKLGKRELATKNNNKIIRQVLDLLKLNGFVESYEVLADSKGDLLKIKLLGSINKTGVIKPRFAVKKDEYEKWEKRYLPARNFGLIIVSTSQGMMTHYDAKEKGLGGRLVSYCY